MEKLDFIVSNSEGQRVDKWLIDQGVDLSRSAIQKLISEDKLKIGDNIEVLLDEQKATEIVPQDFDLDIVFEDECLLIVNKPKGIVVHPATSHSENTLVNFLKAHCGSNLSDINGELRPGIVHRIDKDTSGLLIVAKTNEAHEKLAQQIAVHSFDRIYEAVVYGRIKEESGTVDEPIGRNPRDRKKMTVIYENSKPAVTHYEVISEFEQFTHVRCRLETGRTHQIRVHMAYIHHPIAGDSVYGPKKVINKLQGQCLHAKAIGFIHPKTGEYMYFESELPEYFTGFLKGMK
ncbi:MAG: RluA family pseudouridine synthase [Oscillospiraceae bacterium]